MHNDRVCTTWHSNSWLLSGLTEFVVFSCVCLCMCVCVWYVVCGVCVGGGDKQLLISLMHSNSFSGRLIWE